MVRKKEGAIQAAVEYLNRFGNKVENNLWIGSFKENSFILEKILWRNNYKEIKFRFFRY